MRDILVPKIEGHVLIKDVTNNKILLDKMNAVNYEAASLTLALAWIGDPTGQLWQMCFGNGGATVNGTGAITYFPPNVTGLDAQLYNETYYQVVNQNFYGTNTTSPNNMTVSHTRGTLFSDVVINCFLDYNQPAGQDAFDNSTDINSAFTFNELGMKTFNSTPDAGYLVTHVIFSPVQKALNIQLSVIYTLRLQMC